MGLSDTSRPVVIAVAITGSVQRTGRRPGLAETRRV
jgi:hypothetical protein